jgi:hypothetical protein
VGARAATASAEDAHALYDSMAAISLMLAIPLVFGSLLTGLVMGFGTPWGVFRYYWVVAKLALVIAIILTGSFFVGPGTEKLADDAAAGLEGSALGDTRWQIAIAGATNIVFMLVAIILAVFKPWGRIHLGRHSRKDESEADGAVTEAREPANASTR